MPPSNLSHTAPGLLKFPEVITTPDTLRGARVTPNHTIFKLFSMTDLTNIQKLKDSHMWL